MLSSKGATYGKPVHHGVTWLAGWSHRSVAGHRAGCFEGAEVGFVKILHTNSCRISSSVHFIKPLEGTLVPNGSPNQSTSIHKHREMRGPTSVDCKSWREGSLEKVLQVPHTLAAWRRCSTFQLHHYRGLSMQP